MRRFFTLACLVALPLFACDSTESGTTPEPEPEPTVAGSCVYTNPFSSTEECKRYLGSNWTAETAATDCQSGVFGAPGTFSAEDACDYEAFLGICTIAGGTEFENQLVFPGDDPTICADTKQGCEVFAQGVFEPGPTCDGVVVGGGGGGTVFVQPYLDCRDPLEGEPPGTSEGGQVCTWALISASTEEDRRFRDYASCADILTQRPYYASPPAGVTAADDARLADVAYMTEVDWSRRQVESSACVCCHSDEIAPDGPSQWFVESDGIWLDSISDSGIAMMAGLADSTAFGAFDPSDNNGFDRTVVGVPTTDNDRMRAIFVGEWERRGYTIAEGEAIPPFGGPLVAQLDYVPGACEDGQGLDADGNLQWTGGSARYLYVLEAGAANPGVPPNLDEPAGTLWLVDVPTAGEPFDSGLAYGELRGDMRKRLPEAAPAGLESGTTYYLYVLEDIGLPLTRCLFVAP
jgi:hypothetical protein